VALSLDRRASKKSIKQMIWFSAICLAAGALFAQRFRIIVLVPATVVAIAAGAGLLHTKGVWSTLLMMAAAIVGLQAGYFVGMLIHRRLIVPAKII